MRGRSHSIDGTAGGEFPRVSCKMNKAPTAISKLRTITIRKAPSKLTRHPAVAKGIGIVPQEFKDFREIRGDVVEGLGEMNLSRPTIIQVLALPRILEGNNTLVAAETGSGKTLTYLLPLLNQLKNQQCEGVVTRLHRPRGLVLVPTRELAEQVLSVAKRLTHSVRLRVVALSGGTRRKWIKEKMTAPVEIAIATPKSLMTYQRTTGVKLTDVSHFVIDEGDTMFDKSFKEETLRVLRNFQVRTGNRGTQVTVATATLNEELYKDIVHHIPNIIKVSTKNLHQVLPHVDQTFVKALPNQKPEILLKFLANKSSRYMVFCNSVPSCDWTEHFLRSKGVDVVKLHGGIPSKERSSRLTNAFSNSNSNVLLCTDVISRGIDLLEVDCVVNFDFPLSLVDYLHRAGRTGRVGSKGNNSCVYSILTHRQHVKTALQIQNAFEKKSSIFKS